MNRTEARKLATGCRDLLIAGDADDALAQLRPVVASRTPFPLLDLAGRVIAGAAAINPAGFTALLGGLVATGAIGAWPLICHRRAGVGRRAAGTTDLKARRALPVG